MPKTSSVQKSAIGPVHTVQKQSSEKLSFFGVKLSRDDPTQKPKIADPHGQPKVSSLVNSVSDHLLSRRLAELDKEVPTYRPRARRKDQSVDQDAQQISILLSHPVSDKNHLVKPDVDRSGDFTKPGGLEKIVMSAQGTQALPVPLFAGITVPAPVGRVLSKSIRPSSGVPLGECAEPIYHRETPLKPPRRDLQQSRPLATPGTLRIPGIRPLYGSPQLAKIGHGFTPSKEWSSLENQCDVRAQENFIRIRNGWMKTAKALENLVWTAGSQQAHARRVEKYFVDSKNEARNCDVVIRTADGHTIHAHSLVLAAHSKAFEKRLLAMNPGTGVPTTYRLHLTDKVAGVMVAKAIDWMYKGFTRIPADLLPELTRIARYFHIVPLEVECLRRKLIIDAANDLNDLKSNAPSPELGEFQADRESAVESAGKLPSPRNDFFRHPKPEPTTARSKNSVENVKEIGQSTAVVPKSGAGDGHCETGGQLRDTTQNRHRSPELLNFLEHDAMSAASDSEKNGSFDDIINALEKEKPPGEPLTSIETMTPAELENLLSDDKLDIQSELEVLEAVMTWMAVAPVQREIYIHQLLSCVRFYHLSNEELKLCFKLHPTYFKLPLFRNMVGNAFRAKALMAADMAFPVDFMVLPNSGPFATGVPCIDRLA